MAKNTSSLFGRQEELDNYLSRKSETVPVSIRISVETKAKIDALAASKDTTFSQIAKAMLDSFCDKISAPSQRTELNKRLMKNWKKLQHTKPDFSLVNFMQDTYGRTDARLLSIQELSHFVNALEKEAA